ncbi:MAG: VanZ family protein [Candidatus Nanopelagicales bacterium]
MPAPAAPLGATGLYARYLEPIGGGLQIFLLVAVLLAVPFVVVQYRRRGRVDPRSVWVAGSFLLFLICAWALVLLPFPDDIAKYCASTVGKVNLRPFIWIPQAIEEARREGTGVLSILTNSPLVVRVFNVLLLLPLGVYLRRWWGRGWLATGAIGLGLSLAFELTQLTAIWGLYDCQYRTFDVDDLIANTAGALLGWLAAPAFRIIPERGSVAAQPRPVRASLPRRFVATLIDYLAALLLGGAVVALLGALALPFDGAAVTRTSLVIGLVLVCVVLPVRSGSTVGQWLVLLSMRTGSGERPPFPALAVRTLVLWGPWVLAGVVATTSVGLSPALVLAAVLLSPLWIGVVVLLTLRDTERRGPHEKASGTATVVREHAPADASAG